MLSGSTSIKVARKMLVRLILEGLLLTSFTVHDGNGKLTLRHTVSVFDGYIWMSKKTNVVV